jgi:L-seryl-tRNA(Ser) seleniumtransferase
MIRATVEEIAQRAQKVWESLAACAASSGASIEIVEGNSLVGGGSTPAQSLPTKLLRVTSLRCSVAELERRLRSGSARIPVIARIEDDRLILDLRTVFPAQELQLTQAVIAALSEK